MKIRLSAELRRKVEEAARQNNRTLNSEIVFRLEQSFGTEPARLKRKHWSKIATPEVEKTMEDANIMVLSTDKDGNADIILTIGGRNYSFTAKEEKEKKEEK